MDASKTSGGAAGRHAGVPVGVRTTPVRRRLIAGVAAAVTSMMFVGCAAAPRDPVAIAQAQVTDKQKALSEAQGAAVAAGDGLCTAASSYITALDTYGDVLVKTAPTVGDVRTAGQDLMEPRAETVQAAETLAAARQAVTTAEQELAEAQAALAAAQAAAAGTTPTPSPTKTTEKPSPTPSADPASIARVQQAEAEFTATSKGITDETPLRRAGTQFNAAVVALEMAWLQLFSESGCLADDQQQQAADAVHDLTHTLQQALADAGYYDGKVDGVYGPETVSAVEALQKAHGLPQTGALDKATEAALRADLAAKGASTGRQDTASTAALQQTLKLVGYWDGPIDGKWTDELTQALKDFQTDLGVPATGKVDAATIAAFEEALKKLEPTPTPTPTRTASPRPTSPAPTKATPSSTSS
ncbi:MAG TPA: peptidoglycan-binding domain-containing protein [Micropruina sp.]|nr:peptidoglycan-binding domain-containing protein [Micropruina sp.]